jgi:hypothetical protein
VHYFRFAMQQRRSANDVLFLAGSEGPRSRNRTIVRPPCEFQMSKERRQAAGTPPGCHWDEPSPKRLFQADPSSLQPLNHARLFPPGSMIVVRYLR